MSNSSVFVNHRPDPGGTGPQPWWWSRQPGPAALETRVQRESGVRRDRDGCPQPGLQQSHQGQTAGNMCACVAQGAVPDVSRLQTQLRPDGWQRMAWAWAGPGGIRRAATRVCWSWARWLPALQSSVEPIGALTLSRPLGPNRLCASMSKRLTRGLTRATLHRWTDTGCPVAGTASTVVYTLCPGRRSRFIFCGAPHRWEGAARSTQYVVVVVHTQPAPSPGRPARG